MDRTTIFYLVAVFLGALTGWLQLAPLTATADFTAEIFINLLKLVSLPIIFLSIVSTASGMESLQEIKEIGKKVVKYTLGTTIIAASIALLLFVVIDPVRGGIAHELSQEVATATKGEYLTFLKQTIPSNIVQPFSENNVVGVLLIAMMLSFAMLALPKEQRKGLHQTFAGLYAAIMKVTQWVLKGMPLAVWAFVSLFFRDWQQGLELSTIAYYLVVVVLANLLQAFIVLPLLLKWKGISPTQFAKAMMPALSVAFFSKSSSAALPMVMECSQKRGKISTKVASFTLPLCTTINMNGCAAFILTTVLFVSMSNGVVYSPAEMVLWIFIATIAAVGNAGVPMGCFFLSSAFLASMNVPLNILGVILPFYALIDMLESAINVWSDSCVAAVVDRELTQEAPAPIMEGVSQTT